MNKKAELAAYVLRAEVADEWSMHLAIRTAEAPKWQVLNFGMGVLYAEADRDGSEYAGTTNLMQSVIIKRREDGLFSVRAQVAEQKACLEKEAVLERWQSWISRDMVHFIRQPISEPEGENPFQDIILEDGQTVSASVLEIEPHEAAYLQRKLGTVENIGVDPIELQVKIGEAVSLPELTAHYSDGSSATIPVKWDEAAVAALASKTAGTYEISGEALVGDYPSPMIRGIADPMILQYQGKYYITGTNEYTEGKDLYIRCANSIQELPEAEAVCYFHAAAEGEHSGCNWAPELHVIDGELYCLFASSLNGNWNTVQSRIMHCVGDLMCPENWQPCQRVCKQDGTYLIEDGITLDMTYFEAAGVGYYCWAQRDIVGEQVGTSDLYIARVNRENPVYLASEPVRILRPGLAWDRQHTTVDEGPNVLKHNGKLYMTFSGDSVSDYYCLGLLQAEEDADLLDPCSWKLTGYPVLGRQHVEGERGPGHNAFTKDEYGRDILVYHMKPQGGMRSFSARVIHYGFDGEPLLYMISERYLKPEYRHVTAKITYLFS